MRPPARQRRPARSPVLPSCPAGATAPRSGFPWPSSLHSPSRPVQFVMHKYSDAPQHASRGESHLARRELCCTDTRYAGCVPHWFWTYRRASGLADARRSKTCRFPGSEKRRAARLSSSPLELDDHGREAPAVSTLHLTLDDARCSVLADLAGILCPTS